MKNLKNAKKVLVMIVMVAVIFITTNVFAEDAWADLSGSLNTPVNTSNTNTAGNTTTNALSNTSGTNTSGTTNISNTSNTLNTTLNTANRVNTSSYNSTNLPDTGIEDSLPAVALIVVVGISAVYAYKKIKYYQNI